MGQRFNNGDSIGALSQSLGTITLAASRLTIGGQQYKTTALQVTPTLAANTMYCLYVVLSSGVPTLVASTNVNSVGPAGFTSWKLVGAFLTSSGSAFTQFIPIDSLFNINVSIFPGTSVTINTNVTGFVDFSNCVDSYGLVRQASGAYNSATGNYATSNPRIINPIPNANVAIHCDAGWTVTTANATNSWSHIVRKNAVQIGSFGREGQGANSAGSLNWMFNTGTITSDNCAAGDYFEMLATNNLGNIATYVKQMLFTISTSKMIKDM